MSAAFEPLDAYAHLAAIDQSNRACCRDGCTHATVKCIQFFSVADVDFQAVPFKSAGNVIALQVVGRMTGNGHVVVVNQQLDVQLLSHGQSRRFGVVAFHLRTVGSKHEDNLLRIRDGHSVNEGPHMPQATGRELYARRESSFRMSGKVRKIFAIVIKLFNRKIAFQRCHQVLCGYSVTSFVEKDRQH